MLRADRAWATRGGGDHHPGGRRLQLVRPVSDGLCMLWIAVRSEGANASVSLVVTQDTMLAAPGRAGELTAQPIRLLEGQPQAVVERTTLIVSAGLLRPGAGGLTLSPTTLSGSLRLYAAHVQSWKSAGGHRGLPDFVNHEYASKDAGGELVLSEEQVSVDVMIQSEPCSPACQGPHFSHVSPV